MYDICLKCGAVWGQEEFDSQECDCCGWDSSTSIGEDDFDEDDFDEDDYGSSEEDEDIELPYEQVS